MLAAAAPGVCRAAETATTKPNIVIIFTDDQGYADVGKFGAEGFTTPNLDRMADEGAIFRNFHVAQPVCSASRCRADDGLLSEPPWHSWRAGAAHQDRHQRPAK